VCIAWERGSDAAPYASIFDLDGAWVLDLTRARLWPHLSFPADRRNVPAFTIGCVAHDPVAQRLWFGDYALGEVFCVDQATGVEVRRFRYHSPYALFCLGGGDLAIVGVRDAHQLPAVGVLSVVHATDPAGEDGSSESTTPRLVIESRGWSARRAAVISADEIAIAYESVEERVYPRGWWYGYCDEWDDNRRCALIVHSLRDGSRLRQIGTDFFGSIVCVAATPDGHLMTLDVKFIDPGNWCPARRLSIWRNDGTLVNNILLGWNTTEELTTVVPLPDGRFLCWSRDCAGGVAVFSPSPASRLRSGAV
jgi:hypothetical protein